MLASAVVVMASGCVAVPAPLQRVERTELHMGTAFRIVAWTRDDATAALDAAFARIAALDHALSDYDPASELNALAHRPVGTAVVVSEALWDVLARGQQIAAASDGAFDVTVGPAVALWRRSRRLGALPTAERRAAALASIGWQKVALDPAARTVQLAVPGMRLDLGGIAKGYAAQCACDELRARGITRALVDAGGDLVLGDPPPGTDGWTIALAAGTADSAPTEAVRLARCAIATSGDHFRFVEIDGVRYAHIVDPRTGLGLTHSGVATVVAADGATADAVASAACVVGAAGIETLATRVPGVEILWRDGAPEHDVATRGFPARFRHTDPPRAAPSVESPGAGVLP